MATQEVEVTEKKKRSKAKLLAPLLILLPGFAGGAYFVIAGQPEAAAAEKAAHAAEPEKVELGTVVKLDPNTLNLSDGAVLKVGLDLVYLVSW